MAVSPYMGCIAALVDGGREAMDEVLTRGLDASYFLEENARQVFSYLTEYYLNYTGWVTRASIMGEMQIPVPASSSEPLSYWLAKTVELRQHAEMRAFSDHLNDLLRRGMTAEAARWMQDGAAVVERLDLTTRATVSIRAAIREALERYDKVKAGYRGVPYPWPTYTEATFGIWPNDVVALVARPAVGKTWLLTLMALTAHLAGHRVLFATTEMSELEIGQRVWCLAAGIPFEGFQRGELNPQQEADLRRYVETGQSEYLSDFEFELVSTKFDLDPAALRRAVRSFKPTILLVDSVYLMKSPGGRRNEAHAHAFEEVKRINNQEKVAVCITSQLNRDLDTDVLKKNGKGSADEGSQAPAMKKIGYKHISFSEALVQVCSYIFAIDHTDDSDRKVVQPVKYRATGRLPSLLINWIFLPGMDMSEIGPVGTTDEVVEATWAKEGSLPF